MICSVCPIASIIHLSAEKQLGKHRCVRDGNHWGTVNLTFDTPVGHDRSGGSFLESGGYGPPRGTDGSPFIRSKGSKEGQVRLFLPSVRSAFNANFYSGQGYTPSSFICMKMDERNSIFFFTKKFQQMKYSQLWTSIKTNFIFKTSFHMAPSARPIENRFCSVLAATLCYAIF